jgi:hypothetical protein
MALFFDTKVDDEAADDAVQVVDLGDLVDDVIAPAHFGPPRRLTRRRVTRIGMAVAVAGTVVLVVVAAVRILSGSTGDDVDIRDRQRDLPSLPEPTDVTDPPQPEASTPATTLPGTTAPATTAPVPGLPAAPATGTQTPASTAPPTTARTTQTTVPPTTVDTTSVYLPDGSPNPNGPGPNGPPSGPTTTAPDPWGDDVIPGG